MGWIGTKWTKEESVKDFLAEKCFGSNFEILFYSSKGNVHFFGLKDKEKDELFLSVVIVRFSKSKYYGTEIYFKEMEESTGPFYYANLETLNWLEKNIPIPPNDFAKEWRKNSYEAILKESYNKKNKNIV